MAKRYYWLKLPDGFFRQKAIKKLRKIAGGDTYTIIYLKMLLVAMKQDGRLYFEGVEATFYDELALDLDEEVENVRVTVMFLIQQDLMQLIDETEYSLSECAKMTGSESTSAARVRKYRSKEALTLRKQQYRISEDKEKSVRIARNFILGKVYNSRWVLERAARDYALRLDVEKIKRKSAFLAQSIVKIRECESAEELLGIEGEAASVYFSVFDDLILQQKTDFYFQGRNKRPPLDSVNAMLSFAYSLLAGMCGSALEAVGLDSYVGFFHTDRPGRISLALDLMEEFRSVMADRFVLTLINKKVMKPEYFIKKENGAVIMNDEGRKVFLSAWQSKKQETIKHPFLGEKIEWGMAPYVQSLLLARFLRGDLDEYPPFFWK